VVTDPPTHKHINTHTQTHRQDRLQYTVPQLSRSVMKNAHNVLSGDATSFQKNLIVCQVTVRKAGKDYTKR